MTVERHKTSQLVRGWIADVEAVFTAEEEKAVAGAIDAKQPLVVVGEPNDGPEVAGAEVEGLDAAIHFAQLFAGIAAEGDEGQIRLEAVVLADEVRVGEEVEPGLADAAEAEHGPGRQCWMPKRA